MAEELVRVSDLIHGLVNHNATLMRIKDRFAQEIEEEQRRVAHLTRLALKLDGRGRKSAAVASGAGSGGLGTDGT